MSSSLEPSERELRRAARERALQLLYEAEIKGVPVTDLVAELPIVPAALTAELVNGVAAHRERIDTLLAAKVAPRWTMTRLAAVDRSVLRLGAYELLEAHDRTQAVVINEAVILARRFGSDDSPRFVNGVLSAIGSEVRHGDTDTDAATTTSADTDPDTAATVGDAAAVQAVVAEPLVDAVIMDLDGVIRHWDDEALPAADRQLGLPSGTIEAAAFEPGRFDKAMRGEISVGQWAADIGAAVASSHAVMAEAVTLAFTQVGWRIDQRVMELVDQVRQKVPVALLSNASSRLVDDLRRSHILDHFDLVVGSADIGLCKPDPAAFQAVLDQLDVSAARTLLVDDRNENIAAARELGLQVVEFADVDELENRLVEAGLLIT